MSDRLPDAIRTYARRLHDAIGDDHHIASPLGAWLVLALAASAARGHDAEQLSEVLGMPTDDAARALLDDPHPAVAAAAAVWTATAPAGPAADWTTSLPATVARGPLPDQAGADAWARDHTFGLIEEFPINMTVVWDCVLTSALATRISWSQPFDTADAGEFRSAWRDRVTAVLRTPLVEHYCSIVRHPRAGDLAVHRAYADGLAVTSVIAAPGVASVDVLDAAHQTDALPRTSLFDLPLGDGPSWTIAEINGEDGEEELAAVLPAWSARSRHDLTPPELGFAGAAAVLCRLFAAPNWEAVQAAVARYDRTGFEAAAVTALAVGLSFGHQPTGIKRAALLRFDRPYAVVASVTTDHPEAWHGLPVFSAWVTEPEEVDETDVPLHRRGRLWMPGLISRGL